MNDNINCNYFQALRRFAIEVTRKFSLSSISFNPEDQLKSPIEALLKDIGNLLQLHLDSVTEVQEKALSGRPDFGIAINQLLIGHIELKAPQKDINPSRFKGNDKDQWEKFKNLPNLIYTNGNHWSLYRTGEKIGKTIKFSGDITIDGEEAVTAQNSEALLFLLQDFLKWEPVVPSSPKALAEMLAPICRLLRADVLSALVDSSSNLSNLAQDWRVYFFPDADDKQFADAYAQTLTYALLLAQFSGTDNLSLNNAVKAIRSGHNLLADTLKILGDESVREQIDVSVSLLERIISAIDISVLIRQENEDPWLYFYEDFLAQYDPKMRKERGVYYTPIPVIQAQINLVADLLTQHFDAEFSFVDKNVITLDPACGTGTYILAAIKHGLDKITEARGKGMRVSAATTAATNIHAFEILVGPYAVAHLRLTQQILSEGGTLPDNGVHIYFTDTLESPYADLVGHLPLSYKSFGEEHKRAQSIKKNTNVLVCIGNPPYDRQQINEADQGIERRKGGWVRFGDNQQQADQKGQKIENRAILQDFLDPLTEKKSGVHAQNLYNDYVYFWRWAMWKVFEANESEQAGIVSFITASSYLRGPGFAGMRKVMRQTFDEMWIIDLKGDNLGARKTENVFAIQTPVAIAIGVRYGQANPDKAAKIHYAEIEGTASEKLAILASINSFKDLQWQDCPDVWIKPFLPLKNTNYEGWPELINLFPWQVGGCQFKRKWPIGETPDLLQKRWSILVSTNDLAKKKKLYKETRDRKIGKQYKSLTDDETLLPPVVNLSVTSEFVEPTRYAYRSFDRQWALFDNRLGDYLRPPLVAAHSNQQVYLTSLLTKVLGLGTSASISAEIPDLDYFSGRGAKDIIPLWRNPEATEANITQGVLGVINTTLNIDISAEDFFAYCYGILATPEYVKKFWHELETPGPRIPITQNADLFQEVVAIGKQLIWLHTYGERFVPEGKKAGRVPPGKARCKVGTPTTVESYPEEFSYDAKTQELKVGQGIFENVRPEVWEFSISGLEVVKSWLAYRMKKGAGKKSSPLDDIRPQNWQFDDELLDLLWVLDSTIDLYPELSTLFYTVLESSLFLASNFPQPTQLERTASPISNEKLPLFDGFSESDND
ncbi:MAG: type ISP restriction/modification enzyme [Synechocystis sp.]|nr:type ISP restriction/modification enzyme [Synechocystis sp.]